MGSIARGVVMAVLAIWVVGTAVGCAPYRGEKEAEFELPKGKKYLVFVDPRAGRGVPLDVPPALAKGIMNHLYKYKAADTFVNPEKIGELQGDSEAFEKLDIMTVARATGADVVVYVDLYIYQAGTASEGLLTEGSAAAQVRVVDRDGNRLWPAGANPTQISSVVQPATLEQQSEAQVRKQLLEDLTVRIGRLFHKYPLDDRYMTRGS